LTEQAALSDTETQLELYGELVSTYHSTLDLLSPAALRDWKLMLDEALQYSELIAELAPRTENVLDVGSGVGLPAVPIAVAQKGVQVHLVERRRRRTAFLNLVTGRLGLDNATVHGSDVRELAGFKVQVITAQAVASFSEIYSLTRQLHDRDVWLVSRKGPDWRSEVAALEEATGQAVTKAEERPLSTHGRLIAVFLAGGLACQP
jgi:16S rRNA (guanine(527)-N(7))-methyltransferase RsmG